MVDVPELIFPVGLALAPYQPSQRYLVLDEQHIGNDDLSASNLMTAVIALKQSRSPAGLVRVVDALREQLQEPRDRELKRPFAEWVRRLGQRLVLLVDDEPPPTRTTLEYVRMTLVERVLQWPRRWIQEGLEQGLAHERALLIRQATSRFGVIIAEHLSGTLGGIADPERLADNGDRLVRCDTGGEFLARVGTPADKQNRCDG